MPYIQITYTAPKGVWVKVTDEDAADPEEWDDLFDAINSNADVEHEFSAPVEQLPPGVAKPDRDLT